MPATPRRPPLNPPRHVRVGPYTYRVNYSAAAADWASLEVDDYVRGYCQHLDALIIVRPQATHAQDAETLLHETLHALLEMIGIRNALDRLAPNLEEDVVAALAPALLDVLRRNPRLVAFLVAA